MPVNQVKNPGKLIRIKPLIFYQKKANISNIELVALSGINKNSLRSYRLNRPISLGNAHILSKILDAPVDDLLKLYIHVPFEIVDSFFPGKYEQSPYDKYDILSKPLVDHPNVCRFLVAGTPCAKI